MSENEEIKGKLFVVATPIGNPEDISQRAIHVIRMSDFVICEEYKEGARLLAGIKLNKELIKYNEHSGLEDIINIIDLIKEGKKLALISDCGTPAIADPGHDLIRACIKNNYNMEVVPGASSPLTALLYSGFDSSEFLFAGFLGRTEEDRIRKLKELSSQTRTVILLETPYRLKNFLASASKVLPNRHAYIGFNLTYAYESHHYGTFEELNDKFKDQRLKAEFVVVFEGRGGSRVAY
ncbi:16S rRNA (cytidine(1402)-2'-O)-methyltransferase [Candidatus Kapabacteria bacterium]|nr:16S rRNA (cytidine(1402)-2'-O)-methyltransferase [Candidatus Kapabacteria bacterium]